MYWAEPGAERHAGLSFICPCGCGAHGGVSWGPSHPIWNWDGNEESPTVKDSIRFIGGCEWHGCLTSGEFVPCA